MTKPTEIDFSIWLGKAKRGDRFEYHRGLLVRDRQFLVGSDEEAFNLYEKERHRIGSIGSAAWRQYLAGKVTLVQQRIAPYVCSYIAIAR